MITLTREEAEQVLEHLDDLTDAQQWEIDMHITQYGEGYKPHRMKHMKEQLANTNKTIETLRARLSQPETDMVQDAIVCGTGITKDGKRIAPASIYKEPEPVAWMNEGDIGKTDWKVWAYGKPTATIPLYTAECMPDDLIATYEKGFIDGMQKQRQSSVDRAVNKMAKREWQGLTDEEMSEAYNVNYNIHKEHVEYVDFVLIYRAIEAKLKEKNA
jgi:hypothetical protein